MKQWFIIGGLAVLLVLTSCWIIRPAATFAYKGKVLQGLVGDIAKFHHEKGMLPLNWVEFESWADKADPECHWTAKELNPLFALKWGLDVTPLDSRDEKIFFVLEPRFKDIEPDANGRLHDLCSISTPSSNP